jgi:hypothetical protein
VNRFTTNSCNIIADLHALSLLQRAVSSPDVSWKRILTVEILQLHALKSSLHRLPYRTACSTKLKVKVRDTLRLTVYGQSVCFGVKPLETHDQRFCFPK